MKSPGLSPTSDQRDGSHSATPELQQEVTKLTVQNDILILRVTRVWARGAGIPYQERT